MKNLLIIIGLLFCLSGYGQVNPNHHYVNGYYRSDGTYVQGHYRTNPNSTNRDNYTTKPNVNPWTGKKGYIEPDNNYVPTYNYSTPLYNSTPSYDYSNLNSTSTYKSNSDYLFRSSGSKVELKSNYDFNFSYAAISYHDRYTFSDKKMIEEFLFRNDFDPGKVDGIFTDKTIEAIKDLQRFIGVYADGKFGPNTLKRVSDLLE